MLQAYEPSELAKKKAEAILALVTQPYGFTHLIYPPVSTLTSLYARTLAHVIDSGNEELMDKLAEEAAYVICESISRKNVEECADSLKDSILRIMKARSMEEVEKILARELKYVMMQPV